MALAANRNTIKRGADTLPSLVDLPVLTAVKIYQGALVVMNSSGYAKPGVTGTGLRCIGRAAATVDNTNGASGALRVKIEQGVFRWNNSSSSDEIAADDIGKVCYVVDDETVALTDGTATRSLAGTIFDVDDSGVWVYSALTGDITEALAAEITARQAATTNLRIPAFMPVVLSQAISGATVMRFTPGFAGDITATAAQVVAAVTTASKSAVFTVFISDVAMSGGTVSTTSANLASVGAAVAGSSISGKATFTSTQAITVVSSASTTYAEGQVALQLFLKPAAA